MPKKNLLIIAGLGELPIVASQRASSDQYPVFISPVSSFFFFNKHKYKYQGLVKVPLFSAKKYLEELQRKEISQVLLIGKFEKLYLFTNFHKLDQKALSYLRESINYEDNSLHQQIEKIFADHQIKVLPQKSFLRDLLAEKKDYNPEIPLSRDLEEDLNYGIEISQRSSELEIGQTLVVKNKSVIALEAIEGTNAAIKRGCQLIKKALVIKSPWAKQSSKFDLPAVGPETIKTMARYQAGLLAVKAENTFIVDLKKTLQLANKHKIKLIGF